MIWPPILLENAGFHSSPSPPLVKWTITSQDSGSLDDRVHIPEKHTSTFSFCLPFQMGSTDEEKDLLSYEQIPPFGIIPRFGKDPYIVRESQQEVKKVEKWPKCMEVHPCIFRRNLRVHYGEKINIYRQSQQKNK